MGALRTSYLTIYRKTRSTESNKLLQVWGLSFENSNKIQNFPNFPNLFNNNDDSYLSTTTKMTANCDSTRIHNAIYIVSEGKH